MTINFGGEAWASHVMLISVSASVSYILPRAIYCAYLPGLFTWNMIYSLGTAPRAPNIKLFFFVFVCFCFLFFLDFQQQCKKKQILVSASGLSFLFSFLSFFLFFLLIKTVFLSRYKGHDHWFHCSSVPDGRKYTALQSSLRSCSKLWAKFISIQTHSLNAGVMLEGTVPFAQFQSFPSPNTPPPPPTHYWRLQGRGAVKSRR